MRIVLVNLIVLAFFLGANAQDTIYQTSAARFSFGRDGKAKQLTDLASGSQWLDNTTPNLFSISKGGIWTSATGLTIETGGLLRAGFGTTGVSATFRIWARPDYFVLKLESITGNPDYVRMASIKTIPMANTGGLLGAQWNDQFTIALLALSDSTEIVAGSSGACAQVYSWLGMVGQQVALVAVPTAQFLPTVRKVEQDFHLPSPSLSGQPAKQSKDVKTSYLFVDLTEGNVQDVLHYAALGGFGYVMMYSSTWSSSAGSYPIKTLNFPSGEQGLKNTVDKLHSAGLKAGMHMMTALVSKTDPMVASHNADLLKDTTGALVEKYGTYFVDLRTPLKDSIAQRIAGLINRCGFDMIYFDANEYPLAPYWHWASDLQASIWPLVQRDLLVQGSSCSHWDWHLYSRMASSDYAEVAPNEYMDAGTLAGTRTYYYKSFMPQELGWWGFLTHTVNRPATMPEVMEHLAVRMLAYDLPFSLETGIGTLKANGRSEEMLALLKRYETKRLGHQVPQAVLERLKIGEWHLDETGLLQPIQYTTKRLSSEQTGAFVNPMASQPLKFRLQTVATLADTGNPSNIALLPVGSTLDLILPGTAPMPGALGAKVDLTASTNKPLNLSNNRALAVTLWANATDTSAANCAVLNVQLEDNVYFSNKNLPPWLVYRDYDVNLNFAGTRTIVIPETTPERTLTEFMPSGTNYAARASVRDFNYVNVTALNFRWMRQSTTSPVHCRILRVEALQETPTALTNPGLTIGSKQITLSGTLNTGDYAEYWGKGSAKVFDKNNNLLRTVALTDSTITLPSGTNNVTFNCPQAGAAKITVITLGETMSGTIVDRNAGYPSGLLKLNANMSPGNRLRLVCSLPMESNDVSIRLYDIGGRRVATIFSGQMEAGIHALTWKAKGLSAGAYFVRFAAEPGARVIQKVTMME